jgi:gliding motility-associated-like protein
MQTPALICIIFSIAFNTSLLAAPDIDPIDDKIACSYYVLPPIAGFDLTSDVSYFGKPGGTGIKYLPGDTIFNSSILYAFDSDGILTDEECFFIQIINQLPDLSYFNDTSACTYYVLPYFSTPSISGFAGYYTQPNGEGTRYPQGDTLFSSETLFVYDGYEGCNVEKSFRVEVFDKPIFDDIETQYGCHEYTLIPFAGQNVFADSLSFYFNGQSFEPGDIVSFSGLVDIIAINGACVTIKEFELKVIDEIVIDPIADTFVCDNRILLPDIQGTNVTSYAGYYLQSNGIGPKLNDNHLGLTEDKVVFAYDRIPGTDCADEIFLMVQHFRPTNSYRDFSITVCRGYTYDIYELLLGRNIEVMGNRIESINEQVDLESNELFNTNDYPSGSYQFYVIDTSADVCINDTAIMTVISSASCINENFVDTICIHADELVKLNMTNLIDRKGFCVGGYFTDSEFNLVGQWNELFLLDRSEEKEYRFNYILQDPSGKNDTASVLIKIVDYIRLDFSGTAVLCKGECTTVKLSFLDNDQYPTIFGLESGTGVPSYFAYDSLSRDQEIIVCFLNDDGNQISENPDTINLILSNGEYEMYIWFTPLKDCQTEPNPIKITTLDENTFKYIETLCPGDSVTFEGHTFNESRPSGEILLQEPAVNGCDSFIYVQLAFHDSTIQLFKEEICNEDTVIINCIAYSSAFSRGTQIISGGSIHGCDSIIIIDLDFTRPDTLVIDTVLCPEDFIVIGHQVFDAAGSYDGIIQKQNLCDSLIFNLTLGYTSIPQIQLNLPDNVCRGDTGVVSLNTFYEDILWSTGDTSDQILVTEPGAYSISITTDAGCQTDTTFQIVLNEAPQVTGQFMYQTSINNPIVPELQFGDNVKIKWTPATGLDCDTCFYPVITIAESQVYQFVVTDMYGCIQTGSIVVEVQFDTEHDIYVPSVFNPDSENEANRVFSVFTKGIDRPYSMSIFDRWGGLLFYNEKLLSNNHGMGWDGKINNSPVPLGVYAYTIHIEGVHQPLTGTITVIY